jgi:hypothetical protein
MNCGDAILHGGDSSHSKESGHIHLWRGDLSPLDCAAVPKIWIQPIESAWISYFGAASRPSGDKSPRHRGIAQMLFFVSLLPPRQETFQ